MPSPYNDVELTDTEKGAIYENPGMTEDQNPQEKGVGQDSGFGDEPHSDESPVKEATPAKAEADEGASEELGSDEFNLEDYEVEIDGETFDGAEILKWREDSANKDNWQASNTQKSQEIAKWSKLTNKLSSDDEFRDYVKDYFYEDEKGLKELGLNGELKPLELEEVVQAKEEEKAEAENSKINEVESRLNDMELERMVDDLESELNSIVDNNTNMFQEENAEDDFLSFIEQSQMTNLEDAFKLWSYDKMQIEMDHQKKIDGNKQRNQGKVIHNSDTVVKDVSTPKSYKNMKEINMADPDIAKYFNK
tara:strand:- start:1098 stop:2018 length:921 start_codon:yes stop_codon:yes gene_type:complete